MKLGSEVSVYVPILCEPSPLPLAAPTKPSPYYEEPDVSVCAQVAHVVGVTPDPSTAGTGFGAQAEANGNGGLQEGTAVMEDGVGTSSCGGAAASGEGTAEIQPFDMWSGQVGVGHGAWETGATWM